MISVVVSRVALFLASAFRLCVSFATRCSCPCCSDQQTSDFVGLRTRPGISVSTCAHKNVIHNNRFNEADGDIVIRGTSVYPP